MTLVLLGTSFCTAGGLRAADWLAYRHGLARSGVTEEALSCPGREVLELKDVRLRFDDDATETWRQIRKVTP